MDELTRDPATLRAEARRLLLVADLVTGGAASAVQQVGHLEFSGPAADRLADSATLWRVHAAQARDELMSVAFMLERVAAQIEEQATSQFLVDSGYSSLPSYVGSTPSASDTSAYINVTSPDYATPSASDTSAYINVTSPDYATPSASDTSAYINVTSSDYATPSASDTSAYINIGIPDYASANVGYVDPVWYGPTYQGSGIPSAASAGSTADAMAIQSVIDTWHTMVHINPNYANPIVIL